MNPLLAAGAASVAGEVVSRVAGAVGSTVRAFSAPAHSAPAQGFEKALHRAGAGASNQQRLEDLREQVRQMPEVRQALMNQPVGSVNGIELRADGSAALLTDRGPVEVGLSAESRGTIQDVYRGLAVLAPALPGAAGQAPLQVARGVSGGIPSLVVPASRLG